MTDSLPLKCQKRIVTQLAQKCFVVQEMVHRYAAGPDRLVANATTDQELVVASKSGDLHAFELLVERYYQRVLSFLRTLLRDPDEANDVGQDTFLKAYQCLGSLRSSESFAAWLFRTAYRLGLNRIRANRTRWRRRADEDSATEIVPDSDRAASPHEALLQAEFKETVTQTIRRLPTKYSTVVWLRFGEEMRVADIAAALRLSRAATESRLRRGTELLRKELRKVFPELNGEADNEM